MFGEPLQWQHVRVSNSNFGSLRDRDPRTPVVVTSDHDEQRMNQIRVAARAKALRRRELEAQNAQNAANSGSTLGARQVEEHVPDAEFDEIVDENADEIASDVDDVDSAGGSASESGVGSRSDAPDEREEAARPRGREDLVQLSPRERRANASREGRRAKSVRSQRARDR